MEYDYLIVGAGIAGLHCALRISKAFPKATIAVAEMYNYTGGRIFTYREKGHQWESGAGRFHKSHTMLMKYVKGYGLTPIPIPSATNGAGDPGSDVLSPTARLSSLSSWPLTSAFDETLGVGVTDPLGLGLLLLEDAAGELALGAVGCKIPRTPVRGVPSVPPAVISKVGSE
jgi:hypothetical protein